MMKTDAQLKKDVEAELRFDPAINESAIGVSVKDGVVTLTGSPGSYAEKVTVEHAVERVRGVKGIVVDLHVSLFPASRRPDEKLITAVENALEWNTLVPLGSVRPTVEKGWITLTGDVSWDYERRAAERAVRSLTGVVGVTNAIKLKPNLVALGDVRAKIREALERQADREAKAVEIAVNGSEVRLHGKVHTWGERAAVQGAAYAAPGVSRVINELVVEP